MAKANSPRTQILIAETVRCAFREAFNASVEAAAREAPSSTLDEIVIEFLQAWRREGHSMEGLSGAATGPAAVVPFVSPQRSKLHELPVWAVCAH